MASTYSTDLRLELIADGEQTGTWGATTNRNLGTLLEQAICGVANVAMTDANYTLTTANGVSDEARNMVITMTGALTATRNVVCPSSDKFYIVRNNTTGGQSIVFKTSAGTGVTITNGATAIVYCDSTNVLSVSPIINNSNWSGTPLALGNGGTGQALSDPGADRILFWDDSGSAITWLAPSTGLAISSTNISLSFLGLETLTDPNADRIMFWDDSAGSLAWLTASTGLTITTTSIAVNSASTSQAGIAQWATSAQWRANTSSLVLTTDQVWSAMSEVTLTDASSISWNMASGFDFVVTLGGNRTMGAPTNVKVGQKGRLRVVQDATGSRTINWASAGVFVFNAGTAPTLSTAANAKDVLYYDCIASGVILITMAAKGYS